MDKEIILTESAPTPTGWYSQAIKAGGTVYTSGVMGVDPVTKKTVGPGDITLQTRQMLTNLKELLLAAGSDLDHFVKVTVLIADITQFKLFNEEYKKFFTGDPPARMVMQVGNFRGELVVEVDAIAVVKD